MGPPHTHTLIERWLWKYRAPRISFVHWKKKETQIFFLRKQQVTTTYQTFLVRGFHSKTYISAWLDENSGATIILPEAFELVFDNCNVSLTKVSFRAKNEEDSEFSMPIVKFKQGSKVQAKACDFSFPYQCTAG